MEHAEALERIEIAAVEPDGLERLMAGDTPDAAHVAGHLAGCPSCVAELARIRRTAGIARDTIRSQPDPELRERTLAFVRAVGRDRSGAAAAAATSVPTLAPTSIAPASAPVALPGRPVDTEPTPITSARSRGSSALRWIAAVAAVAVVAVGVGYAAGGTAQRSDVAARDLEIAVLVDATSTALRVQAQPDAQQVALVATPTGGSATGNIAFSPTTGEMVAVAWDLAPAAAGQEYRCWVEADGQRTRLGRMYWAGDLWSWAGPVDGLAELAPDAVFGVSLGPASGGAGETVLTGSL